jgi:hypothetical protein
MAQPSREDEWAKAHASTESFSLMRASPVRRDIGWRRQQFLEMPPLKPRIGDEQMRQKCNVLPGMSPHGEKEREKAGGPPILEPG